MFTKFGKASSFKMIYRSIVEGSPYVRSFLVHNMNKTD